jgi:histidine ammonia-lyase
VPGDLDPALIAGIAAGRRVTVTPGLLAAVQRQCDAARAVLASGDPVYGVNTGMGALSGVRLSDAEQRAHQRNLLLARAVGGPPWLSPGDVRALYAVRLRTFLSGDAGVSAALCQQLVDFLNAGLVPAVPRGGVGSAGEIIPLAHAFGPLAGLGSLLGPDGTLRPAATVISPAPPAGLGPAASRYSPAASGVRGNAGADGAGEAGEIEPGRHPTTHTPAAGQTPASTGADGAGGTGETEPGRLPTAQAPAADHAPGNASTAGAGGAGEIDGSRLEAVALGPKEGISLLAGVPGATALSLRRAAEAGGLLGAMEAAAVLAAVAAGVSRDPYEPEAGRGDDQLVALLSRMRQRMGEPGRPAALQAPVSFRVAGPVLAHAGRARAGLLAEAGRALAGVTDSPAFLDGRFTGTAGFHGLGLAAGCDRLAVALIHAAEVAAARLHRLLNPAVTGLAAQLAVRPGPDAGMVTVHKRAVGEVHALRRLALATPVGLIETSGGQEDVQSFAWEAAENLRAALRGARVVTACELLAGFQAHTLAGQPAPAGCAALLGWLAGRIPPVTGDRPFGTDIERLTDALADIGGDSFPY